MIGVFGFVLFSGIIFLAQVDGRKEIVLSRNPRYVLGYEANGDEITIDVVAKTLGYIGFGVSLFPNMTGADLVIAGVYPDGTTYLSDYHGGHGHGSKHAIMDESQDWIEGPMSENQEEGTTSVSFTRLLVTDDAKEDLPIKNEEIWVLWAVGRSDDLQRHTSSGSVRLNLLAP